MRFLLVFVFFIVFHSFIYSQKDPKASITGEVTLQKYPQDMQICSRSWDKSTAEVTISGTVKEISGYDHLQLLVSKNSTEVFDTLTTELSYDAGLANFELVYLLPASFTNHEFSLHGIQNTNRTLEWKAIDVVAGDIFLINGQSNAQAYLSPMPEDVVPYTRSYKNGQWRPLNYAFPGHWGAHVAKVMANYLDYPIGVFNYADGAEPISYFQKDLQDSTQGNYGGMLDRFQAAGVKPIIAFWFHGEANGWDTPLDEYKEALNTLHDSWKTSFGIQGTYVFQVRHKGCAHPNPDIFEAQRVLSEELSDMHIMSTTNADQDSCHYRWEEGYKALAQRMAEVIKYNQYGDTTVLDANFAPNVNKIELYDSLTLYVTFDPPGVPLEVIGDPSFDFKYEEADMRSVSVETLADTLVVKFDVEMAIGEHLTYLAHPGPTPDWVVTEEKKVGILEFWNQVIEEYIPFVDTMVIDTTDTVSIVQTSLQDLLDIYPNPSIQSCHIDWRIPQQVDIHVVDAIGNVVFRRKEYAQDGIDLDLKDLPAGFYMVVIRSKDSVRSGKIIKRE